MSNLVKHLRSARMIFPILVSIVLFGCGGGNTPPSVPVFISGTAAAGAPVVGYVSVRDSSSNPQPVRTGVPIDANGNFTVEVTGLTAPYAFMASGTVGGRSMTLYSVVTSADAGGTINITPFTDLMIRNIAASAVDNYIDTGGFGGLTTAELDAARVTLTQQLAPALLAMGLSDSIDLLRATFNADGTGLDRFMDVVRVSTTPTTATITNIMDAANTLIIDTINGTTTGSLGTGGLAPAGTDFDGIVQTLNAFADMFATSLPSASDPALLALFADTYMDGGTSRDAFLTDLTTDPDIIGFQITSIVVDELDLVAGTAFVHFVPVFAGNLTFPDKPGGVAAGYMVKIGDEWKINGDQRIAGVNVRASADRLTCNPANLACLMTPAQQFGTGLKLSVYDDAMIGVETAVVTGPGLPAGGVTLNNGASTIVTNNLVCGTGCPLRDVWLMLDGDIGAIQPNSVYVFALYNGVGTLMATYSETLPMPPVLNTQLASLPFPSLSGLVDLTGAGAVTITPSWSVPGGTRPGKVAAHLDAPFEHAYISDDLSISAATSGTSTLVVNAPLGGGTWSSGWYSIQAYDQYAGERFAAYW
ncbi:MAG: hypothetical protein KKH12_10305 [Gammaproteobacteria bacterium]|nr:hypothetical protein [Gammaproteobacteria bacterium]MBU1482052.1 hypothetical protein [Gammaproteobacteria bacterium]